MTKGNPDLQLHVFRTFLGLPPDTSDQPVCGAVLAPAHDDRPRVAPRDRCPACEVILADARRAR